MYIALTLELLDKRKYIDELFDRIVLWRCEIDNDRVVSLLTQELGYMKQHLSPKAKQNLQERYGS